MLIPANISPDVDETAIDSAESSAPDGKVAASDWSLQFDAAQQSSETFTGRRVPES